MEWEGTSCLFNIEDTGETWKLIIWLLIWIFVLSSAVFGLILGRKFYNFFRDQVPSKKISLDLLFWPWHELFLKNNIDFWNATFYLLIRADLLSNACGHLNVCALYWSTQLYEKIVTVTYYFILFRFYFQYLNFDTFFKWFQSESGKYFG